MATCLYVCLRLCLFCALCAWPLIGNNKCILNISYYLILILKEYASVALLYTNNYISGQHCNKCINEGLMQVAAWYRGGKITCGRQTTTSGLTETANSAVWTRTSIIRKPLNGRKAFPVTCDVEYSLPTSRWTGSSSPVVGWRPVALCTSLLATTQCNARYTGENRPPTAVSG